MTCTPGESNEKAELFPTVCLESPEFSAESGFYEDVFALRLTAPQGYQIYYTLDGSNPTKDSVLYREPIEIADASGQENRYAARTDLSPTRDYTPDFKVDKATVVRAVCYDERRDLISEIETKVYFVGFEGKKEYQDFSIVSLAADPAALFDAETGIYGNGAELERYKALGGLSDGKLLEGFEDDDGKQHHLYMASNAFHSGKEWEREAAMAFFDETHTFQFAQDVGIRIAGESTRGTPQKSFKIYGRDIYDETVMFPYTFFEGTEYSSIKLRNGGSLNSGIKITDAFLEGLAENREVAIQRAKPCILFLNGEYWGIYFIRERYKEEYLANYYGVEQDNAWIVDGGVARTGGEEAYEAFQNLMDTVRECDLSYDDTYAMISERIEIQSLIDYCCLNLYIDNRDISFTHNTAQWRAIQPDGSRYGDGKWRMMVFDVDDSLHADSNDWETSSQWLQTHPLLCDPVVQSFFKNSQFCEQFCKTLMDIGNTVYRYETVQGRLAEWERTYKEQIVKNHRRFFDAAYSAEDFEKEVENIESFFRQRFSFMMESMAYQFGLQGTLEKVTIGINDPKGGKVQINTALLDAEKSWSGQYYTDYPITVQAIAAKGYHFAGWKGDASGKSVHMEMKIPEGGLTLEAVFEKDGQ